MFFFYKFNVLVTLFIVIVGFNLSIVFISNKDNLEDNYRK